MMRWKLRRGRMMRHSENYSKIQSLKKRRGSISLFLTIAIPVIIMGVLKVYDLSYARHRDEKALKVIYAVSEARLATYNEFLKEEYCLFANLEVAPLADYAKEYLEQNGYDAEVETELYSLDNAEIFRQTAVRSSMGMFAEKLLNMRLEKVLIAETEVEKEVMSQIEDIDSDFEKLGELLKIPGDIKKLSVRQRSNGILTSLKSAELTINSNKREFDEIEQKIVNDLDGMEAGLDEGLLEFKTELLYDLAELREAFDKQNAELTEFIDKIRPMVQAAAEIEDEISDLKADVGSIKADIVSEELKQNPDDALIAMLEAEIDATMAEMRKLESEHQEARVEIDSAINARPKGYAEGGYNASIKDIRRALKSARASFKGVEANGADLKIEKSNAEKIKEEPPVDPHGKNFGNENLIEKLAFVEWSLEVFGCHEKDCAKEGRTIIGELEYIVSGDKKSKSALVNVKLKIAGIRFPTNYMAFLKSDARKEIDMMLALIPPPFYHVVKPIAWTVVVACESYIDVNRMLAGKKLNFFKTSDEWFLSFDNLLKKGIKSFMEDDDGSEDDESKYGYRDYLRLLLWVQGEEKTVGRAMDLIEVELKKKTDGKYSLSSFSVGHEIDISYENDSIMSTRNSKIHFENAYD